MEIPAKIGHCEHCGVECLLLNDTPNCLPCNRHGKLGKDGTRLVPRTVLSLVNQASAPATNE